MIVPSIGEWRWRVGPAPDDSGFFWLALTGELGSAQVTNKYAFCACEEHVGDAVSAGVWVLAAWAAAVSQEWASTSGSGAW